MNIAFDSNNKVFSGALNYALPANLARQVAEHVKCDANKVKVLIAALTLFRDCGTFEYVNGVGSLEPNDAVTLLARLKVTETHFGSWNARKFTGDKVIFENKTYNKMYIDNVISLADSPWEDLQVRLFINAKMNAVKNVDGALTSTLKFLTGWSGYHLDGTLFSDKDNEYRNSVMGSFGKFFAKFEESFYRVVDDYEPSADEYDKDGNLKPEELRPKRFPLYARMKNCKFEEFTHQSLLAARKLREPLGDFDKDFVRDWGIFGQGPSVVHKYVDFARIFTGYDKFLIGNSTVNHWQRAFIDDDVWYFQKKAIKDITPKRYIHCLSAKNKISDSYDLDDVVVSETYEEQEGRKKVLFSDIASESDWKNVYDYLEKYIEFAEQWDAVVFKIFPEIKENGDIHLRRLFVTVARMKEKFINVSLRSRIYNGEIIFCISKEKLVDTQGLGFSSFISTEDKNALANAFRKMVKLLKARLCFGNHARNALLLTGRHTMNIPYPANVRACYASGDDQEELVSKRIRNVVIDAEQSRQALIAEDVERKLRLAKLYPKRPKYVKTRMEEDDDIVVNEIDEEGFEELTKVTPLFICNKDGVGKVKFDVANGTLTTTDEEAIGLDAGLLSAYHYEDVVYLGIERVRDDLRPYLEQAVKESSITNSEVVLREMLKNNTKKPAVQLGIVKSVPNTPTFTALKVDDKGDSDAVPSKKTPISMPKKKGKVETEITAPPKIEHENMVLAFKPKGKEKSQEVVKDDDDYSFDDLSEDSHV